MQSQRIELLSGMAASVCGVLGLAAVLFAPLSRVLPDDRFPPYHLTGSSLAIGPSGLQLGWVFDHFGVPLALSALLVLAIGVGAVAHSFRRAQLAHMLLWSATGGLLVVILLASVPYLQITLVPSLVLALVASGASNGAGREQWPVVA